MTLFLWLFGLSGMGLFYYFIVRPILSSAPIMSEAFAKEASLLDKVRVYITGWRTKIMARLFTIGGLLLGFYDFVIPIAMGQDWSSITNHLPPWAMPVMITTAGVIFGWLRKITDNPPQIVTQKDEDTGVPKVVAVIKPTDPAPTISTAQ